MPLETDPALDRFVGRPVERAMIAVFADSAYLPLLSGWAEHAVALNVAKDVVVFALDGETSTAAATLGLTHVTLGPVTDLADLWRLRVRCFATLVRRNIGFVHSDVDAIWLAGPRPRISALASDIVFSQGTVWPPDVARAWGFVLCCGFFHARATSGVAAFLQRVTARLDIEPDDQVAVNRALKSQGIIWDAIQTKPEQYSLNGCDFLLLEAPVTGVASGLHVSVLPHNQVPRLAERPSADALVVHPLSPKRLEDKLALFKTLGLWHENRN